MCSSRRRARTVFIDAGLSEAVKNEVCLFGVVATLHARGKSYNAYHV
mgnify:CR=1 FL=1